ncbi:MAG: hypothetical protein ACE5H4_04710 [Candidatus Thorarchaeota archaeon]
MRIFKAIKRALEGIWDAQKASLAGPLIKAKTVHDDAMMFIVLGDLLGYPFQSTFYSRLLFTYWLTRIPPWKQRLLKEQDVLAKMHE